MLGVCWGFIADCDLSSEKIRWMGFARTYFWIALRVLRPISYHGSVSYLPLPTDSTGAVISTPEEPIKMPSLSEPVPEDWVTEEGPFLNVYAVNQVMY